MTNSKRKGGTRRKKGGLSFIPSSMTANIQKMQGHLDRGIAAAKKVATKTAAGAMSAVPSHHLEQLATHATNVKASLAAFRGTAAEKAGEAHAQVVGHLNTLVGHAEKHFPAAAGHFRQARTMASMSKFMSSAKSKSRKFGFGGYGSKKKHSGGTKRKCSLSGGYRKKHGGTKKKRGGNKTCGHTKKRPHKKRGHKRGGTRTRRGGNCKKCGM